MACENIADNQVDYTDAHVGDVNAEIRIRLSDCGVVVDLTVSSGLIIKALAPSGTMKEWPASIYGDPTDGTIHYFTKESDLDEPGVWELQVYGTIAGWNGHAERVYLDVFGVLK